MTGRTSNRFTATDALALDVEQVVKWAHEVVADEDAPTEALVSVVASLREAYDLLADYLFQTSEPAQEAACADVDAPPARLAASTPCAEARGGSERERAGSPMRLARGSRTPSGATPSGQPSKHSPPPSNHEGAFHE